MRIGLSMIVKNKARGILRTLESCHHLLDTWDIVDTGSTDGTQELVAQALQGIPGALHSLPFVDFSTTRNAALDLAQGDWVLLLSGDELVTADHGTLWRFLEASPYAEHDAEILFGDLTYGTPRLVRPAWSGRYSGVTHEALTPRNLGPRAPIT